MNKKCRAEHQVAQGRSGLLLRHIARLQSGKRHDSIASVLQQVMRVIVDQCTLARDRFSLFSGYAPDPRLAPARVERGRIHVEHVAGPPFQAAAMACTSTRNGSSTSRETISSVFGG
jgi:hypothetical protein